MQIFIVSYHVNRSKYMFLRYDVSFTTGGPSDDVSIAAIKAGLCDSYLVEISL